MARPTPSDWYPWALQDGAIVPFAELSVHAEAHALRYGLSVFEGLRAYAPRAGGPARLFALGPHLERMRRSLELAELPAVDLEQLERDLGALLTRNQVHEDAYLRVAATATSLGTMDGAIELTTFASVRPMGRKRWLRDGARMRLALGPRKPEGTLLPHAAKLIAHYAGAYRATVHAKRAGFDGVLLLDHHGRLAEAPTANLLLVRGQKLLTPRLDCGILPGVTRSVLLELARSRGLETEETALWPADLADIDEALLCGTGIELAPIACIGDVTFSESTPVTSALVEAYFEHVRP
ncbi:aminotransferase class IV [Haliangium ochraceum]|uniref:Aminotransferase class IV n=1 Tax=Haliangium ochraceum (strain DSM 14365 / JCM 11303 / SMP-2) TaxID=502025 RepID=D0LRX6_HALO1|nr:aminotransferase class IV [Haliangium ochraceum]ACY13673.1 aminotransferase class IV [Haliangium ochraceum DSM 14365]